jgi:hypothetical protein
LGGIAFFFAVEDEEAPASGVFSKARPAPCHGGIGRWRWLLCMLAAAATTPLKGKMTWLSMVEVNMAGAIDGGVEAEAAAHAFSRADIGDEATAVAERGSPGRRTRTRVDTAVRPCLCLCGQADARCPNPPNLYPIKNHANRSFKCKFPRPLPSPLFLPSSPPEAQPHIARAMWCWR